ncbi:hypothetical protein OEG84_12490 [Hoeflea sp. G2-23]|uniref:Uncharacterized protein n=1 Tax=Hoeflea algicola TaxID=2983763 RepID=A0ABT3Z9Q2_9HYPH|nr:hypothetical protein [Hoeflea algicola]MCY0148511.1 hypothetical protein [Hoeflea algicola]
MLDLFSLLAGDRQSGERGIGCLPERIGEFRCGNHQAIAYEYELGCSKMNYPAGIPAEDVEPVRLGAVLFNNLRYAAPRLSDAGRQIETCQHRSKNNISRLAARYPA